MTTDFKLNAADFHLKKIINLKRAWKSIVGTKTRFKTDVAVDGFLCEVMSAVDSLLHDINKGLKLKIPVEDVCLNQVKKKMRECGFNVADLGDLNNLYLREHWLSDLRKLRNYSVHTNLLGWAIKLELPAGITEVYLKKPWIHGDGETEKEIIPYFREQLKKVRILVKDVKVRLKLS